MIMYTPYLRGWQQELRALQKSVNVLRKSSIVPILEPVKMHKDRLLEKTLTCFRSFKLPLFFIINPICGELKHESTMRMFKFIHDYPESIPAFIVDENTNLESIRKFAELSLGFKIALVHYAPVKDRDGILDFAKN